MLLGFLPNTQLIGKISMSATCSCLICSVDAQQHSISSTPPRRSAHDWEDLGLSIIAVLLSLLIAVIVVRKIAIATGHGADVGMDADMSSFE